MIHWNGPYRESNKTVCGLDLFRGMSMSEFKDSLTCPKCIKAFNKHYSKKLESPPKYIIPKSMVYRWNYKRRGEATT